MPVYSEKFSVAAEKSHISAAVLPHAPAVSEKHITDKVQKRRFPALIFSHDHDQLILRRFPADIAVNAVSLQL